MSETAEQASAGRTNEQADFWADLATKPALAAAAAGTPEKTDADEPAADEQADQQFNGQAPEGTQETDDQGTRAAGDVGDEIPEQYQPVLERKLKEKEALLQAGYTQKFQALADERKQVEGLLAFAKSTGIPVDEAVKYATAFKQLQEAKGVRITQGDKVLWESDGAEAEPDFDTMTKAEMAAYLRKERERDRQALLNEIKSTVQPIQAARQVEDGKRLVAEWRASRKDLSDEVIALTYAKVREYEKLLPQGVPLDLSTVEKIDAFLSPHVAVAQGLVSKSKPQGTSPTTEIPTKPSRPAAKDYRKMSFEALAEEAARKSGHASLTDALGKFGAERRGT